MAWASREEIEEVLEISRETARFLKGQADRYRSDADEFRRNLSEKMLTFNGAGLGVSVAMLSSSSISISYLKFGGLLFWLGFLLSVVQWFLTAGLNWLAVPALDRARQKTEFVAEDLSRALDGKIADEGERAAVASSQAVKALQTAKFLADARKWFWFLACLFGVAGATLLLIAGLLGPDSTNA
jgi:hypothetical protein